MASFDIRSYREWFLDADYTPAYEAHHRTLQQLQWRNPGRWVLKYPKHLLSLDASARRYPDAVLIWTHRDPAAVLPSAVSLTGFMRQSNTPDYDPVRFAREWVVIEELALHRGLRHARPRRHTGAPPRRRLPGADGRPGRRRSPRCANGWAWPSTTRRGSRCSSGSTTTRRTSTACTATPPADFGLDADRLRARFDFYTRRFL